MVKLAGWIRSRWNSTHRDSLITSAHVFLMGVIAVLFLYFNKT